MNVKLRKSAAEFPNTNSSYLIKKLLLAFPAMHQVGSWGETHRNWKEFSSKAREPSVNCVRRFVTAQGSESNLDWKLFLSRAYMLRWCLSEERKIWASGRSRTFSRAHKQVKTLRSRPSCQWVWCECVCVLKFHISRVTLRCTPLFTFEKVTVEKRA